MRVHSTDEATVDIGETHGIRVAEIIGSLDLTNSHVVLSRLQDAADEQPFFIVSLAECSFCDSHGLATLIALRRQMGGRFAIVLPEDSRLRQLFRATSLDKLIHIENSPDDAVVRLTGNATAGP